MVENVRLVVWDLDETFWRGTLTEGGINYCDEHHNIVIELAHRGVMSAICSKNDLGPVRKILQEKRLWDYFIFPSINWEPKGPRIAALIEAVQLRAGTVMFIDDNPLNRSEAQHYVPDLQVADETIVAGLLDHPLFKGKDDSSLSRLKQYKVLEEKQEAKVSASDVTAFLRDSGIEVTIEHDVKPHLDRVIELINRTNQLNFTKKRLPEDLAQAKAELLPRLNDIFHHVGLVHVKDRYGDYGFVGFYMTYKYGHVRYMEHFCFSCRTLGMGIENWVYDKLGRPAMSIVGEVLSDLNFSQKIDWINQKKEEDIAKEKVFDKAVIRGGCAIMSLGHYLELYSEDMISEHNYARKVGGIRVDHSSLLHMAMFGASEEDRRTAQLLGYTDEDINSSLADIADDVDFCVLNFVDGLYSTYSRNGSSLRLPIPECRPWMTMNFTDEIHKDDNPALQSVFDALHSGEFQHHDPDAEHFQQILRDILNEIPDRVIIFFLLGPEFYKSREGDVKAVNNHVAFNDVMRSVAAARHRTFLLSATDFVVEPGEQLDNNHFGRMVFYRMAQQIISTVSGLNQLSVQEAV